MTNNAYPHLNKSLQKNKRKARSKVAFLYAIYLTFVATVLYVTFYSNYLTALKMFPVGLLISFILFFLGLSVSEEKRMSELQRWSNKLKEG